MIGHQVQRTLSRATALPQVKTTDFKAVMMKYSGYLLILLAVTARAEVYKSVDANGEVIYSDVPSVGAKRVQMPELPTYTPAPLPVVASPAPDATTQAVADTYSAFSLTSPGNEETIRGTAGMVKVSVALDPALRAEKGDRIQYLLDNRPHGEPVDRLSTSFDNVDRGTHTVSAAVVDDSGKPIIKTSPVTIYIHR